MSARMLRRLALGAASTLILGAGACATPPSRALVAAPGGDMGSAFLPHDWSGYVPTNIRNEGTRPIVIDRITPLKALGGLVVDRIVIVGPRSSTVANLAGEGWPPEYGHAAGETPWTVPESEMREVAGVTIPAQADAGTTAPPPDPIPPFWTHPDEPNSVSVMFKAKLRDNSGWGELPGYNVYYHEVGGPSGVLNVRAPFRICSREALTHLSC